MNAFRRIFPTGAKWALVGLLAGLAAALVVLSWGLVPWAVSLGLGAGWLALVALVGRGIPRRQAGRAALPAALGFLLVLGLDVFAVLWVAGAQIHLGDVSRQLLAGKAEQRVIAFVDVNVVPMEGARLLAHQTVIVSDGRIAAIGPVGTTALPPGARQVAGHGQYLLPGLTDMHAHILINLDDPLLFVANGVTAVRSMSSYGPAAGWLIPNLPYRSHADLRDKIARGELVGPALFLAPGPIEDGASPFVRGHDWLVRLAAPIYRIVSTPEEAVHQVAEVQADGFDSVKTYSYLRADEYMAVAAAARERGLHIVGHVPRSLPVADALASGQWWTIEHLSGYMHPCGGLKIPAAEVPRYARLTADSGVWNVPTLVAFANVPPPTPPELRAALATRPENRFVSPWMQEIWQGEYRPFDVICAETTPTRYPSQNLAAMQGLVRAFRDAGAGILLGSDAAAPYIAPGFAIHDELRLLVDAGLTPYEALRAGTYNAAAALGRLDDMGTVAVGKRADLILVAGNPLEDVGHLRERAGVMVQGRWFTAAELQAALDTLARGYTAQ